MYNLVTFSMSFLCSLSKDCNLSLCARSSIQGIMSLGELFQEIVIWGHFLA